MDLPDKSKKEIYPLTGIRAFAAIWVVSFHMENQIAAAYPDLDFIFSPVISHGYLGVDLFFILSGFIIFYNYEQKLLTFRLSVYRDFLWMRLARIWPVHMAILIAFAALIWWRSSLEITPTSPELYSMPDLLKNVFLIQGWQIPLEVSWNAPAWSVSCEWLAYLVFPLLIISKSSHDSPYRSMFVALFTLVVTAAACQLLHADEGARYGVVRIAGEFIAGCGLCKAFQTGITRKFPWHMIVPITIVAVMVCSSFILPTLNMVSYWCIPLLGIIVLGLAHDQCIVSKLCSTKIALFGGYISYSIYMVHTLCLIGLRETASIFGETLAPITNLAAIILVATCIYYLVEEPCRKKMRRLMHLFRS